MTFTLSLGDRRKRQKTRKESIGLNLDANKPKENSSRLEASESMVSKIRK
jgi:hypothetical protein